MGSNGFAISRREEYTYGENRVNLFNKSTVNYKRSLLDIGGGYFTTINPARSLGLSLFGGIGLTSQLDPYSRFHNSQVRRIFFQPAFIVMPGRYFRMMLVHRFSFVHYGDISTSYSIDEKSTSG